MKLVSNLLKTLGKVGRRIEPSSLQFRLTLGITTVSILGVGSVAVWTSWEMQQTLIDGNKQKVEYIADRFPHDLKLYSQMLPVETGIVKAIDNLTAPNLFIWVKRSDGMILAKSDTLNGRNNGISAIMMSLPEMSSKPQVTEITGRYLIVCSSPLRVKGKVLGQLYLAQDITEDRSALLAMQRSLGIASIVAIIVITVAVALYVRRSLQPLRRLSQMTAVISADDLGRSQVDLDRAPSEVKELAQTFNMMLDRLSASWEQQRQFVSNVSHELRTPLTIVHGYLQSVLRRKGNLTAAQQEALEIAADEADRTVRLLQDLLDLARATDGYMHFNCEPLVINDLVAEVAGMAEKFSNRMIGIQLGTSPVVAMADSNRLKQVLINLIDNAVKYSDSSTPITIKIDQIDEQVTIEVSDRGCGIPLQHQARIFERFYRADEARTRSTGGAGLGLSIVKTLVEGMGGSVKVRSQPGEGSIFTVTLSTPPSKP